MMASMCTRSRIAGLLFALAFAFLLADPAHGSHFRYGHITWEPRPDISPTTVDFRFTVAARRSFYGNPNVGDTINMISQFRFGNGASANPSFEVIASNPEEDWVIGVARTSPGPVIRKTYPAPLNSNDEPWSVEVNQCCRLGALRNAGGSFRVEASVDLSDQLASPLSNVSPIVTCGRNGCTFPVPAVDPDGNGLRWRPALGSESRITQMPSGGGATLEINESTGVVTWNTNADTPLGLYSIPLQIEDLDEAGEVRNSVPLEFIVRIDEFDDNAPPTFDAPPTPGSDETLTVPHGASLQFTVQASDPDPDDTVILNHTGLPAGASFEPVEGNPAVGTFTWRPTETQLGEHLLTFSAIDSRGAAAVPHPLRIEVVDPAIRDVSVTAEINSDRIVIDPDSFATEPDTIEQIDDATRVVWTWPTLTPEAREELDLAVSFLEPEAAERRVLTWLVTLEYTDIDGNRVERTLDTQYVEVLPSIFDVGAATDRGHYGPDDTVAIQATLENLSRFTADGELALAVMDAAGAMVADLGRKPAPGLEAGASRTFDDPTFHTAGIFAGDYAVRAQALDEAGRPVAEAAAPFTIGTGQDDGESVLAGRVTTERSTYDPGGTVTVTDLVSNVGVCQATCRLEAHSGHLFQA